MSLTKKQELFCQYYTDSGAETLGNGAKSARKAGYSKNTSKEIGSRLLTKPAIKLEIARLENLAKEKYEKSKEDAILEARQNYEQAKRDKDKQLTKYWYDMWVNLQSWLVTKTENVNVELTIEQEKDALANMARGMNLN